MRIVLLAILASACNFRQEFRGATPADAAACRNVARQATRENWGHDFDNAWNDCMTAKGFKASDS